LGDADEDGLNDIAVSAMWDDLVATNSGSVYILYMNANDTVRGLLRISRASGEGLDSLTVAIGQIGRGITAISPRFQGHTVSVAAGSTVQQAIVLIHVSVLGVQSAEVLADGMEGISGGTIAASSNFGHTVNGAGDMDGNGAADLAVGAFADSAAGTSSGAVYILFLNPGSEAEAVSAVVKLIPTTGGLNGVIPVGSHMASGPSIGDLDGDGRAELVISVMGDNFGGADRGSIVVAFMGGIPPSSTPAPTPSPTASSTPSASPSSASVGSVFDPVVIGEDAGGLPPGIISPTDTFGKRIAGIGDIDEDGIPDIAVGAERDDDGATDAGAVYIVFMNSDRTAKGYQKISRTAGGGELLGPVVRFGFAPSRLD